MKDNKNLMENLTLNYKQQLEELAKLLVTPKRFGEVALISTVQTEYPDLPETQSVFELPPFRNGQAGVGA